MARIFLAMNGKRINSLGDLKNNFNPNQMLAFYKGKRLQAWLEEQGLADELENLNSFDADMDDDTLLSMLMALFELNDEQIAKVKKQMQKTEPESAPTVLPTEPNIELITTSDDAVCESKKTQDSLTVSVESSPSFHTGWTLATFTSPIDAMNEVKLEPLEEDGKKLNCYSPSYSPADSISGTFFYDGFFWAKTGSLGKIVVLKSRDLKTWKKDETLTALNYDWDHVVIGDKHCFLFKTYSVYGGCVVGSPSEGWKNIDYAFDCSVDGISNMFERDGTVGIFYKHSYETGFIKKETHIANGLLLCDNFFDFSKNQFYNLNINAFSDNGFIFKNRCFYWWSGFFNGDFKSADMAEWNFESVRIGIIPGASFVFADIAFVTCGDKLSYSRNGVDWESIDYDFIDNPTIVEVNDIYYAVARAEKSAVFGLDALFNHGPVNYNIFRSRDGVAWEKWMQFTSNLLPSISAGNGKLLISTGQKYLFYSDGTVCQRSSRSQKSNDYFKRVKTISAQIKEIIAKELDVPTNELEDETDLIYDLHAGTPQLNRVGAQLNEVLGAAFPNGEIPHKVIDIIVAAVECDKIESKNK